MASSFHRSAALSFFALGSALVVACSEPGAKSPRKEDVVAVNSAYEGSSNSGSDETRKNEATDPAQPYTVPVRPESSAGGPKAAGPGNGGSTKATGNVSKAECNKLFDKYMDLAFTSDERLEGVPPEMIAAVKAQARAQASAQKGDPCSTQEVPRAKYNCAMAARTTHEWEECMQ
ncbi:MAG: hypothetical protein FWD69_14640 [Polyangiaceae bacterium]|nr:hypothetical protein [Polyangiaceae bacterium]